MPDRAAQQQFVSAVLISQDVKDNITLTVNGACMAPLLKDGDVCEVSRQNRYYCGDVLVIKLDEGAMVVHRLLGWVPDKNGWRAMTKADNGAVIDALSQRSRVIGKVDRIAGRRLSVTLMCRGFSILLYVYHLCRLIVLKLTNRCFSFR